MIYSMAKNFGATNKGVLLFSVDTTIIKLTETTNPTAEGIFTVHLHGREYLKKSYGYEVSRNGGTLYDINPETIDPYMTLYYKNNGDAFEVYAFLNTEAYTIKVDIPETGFVTPNLYGAFTFTNDATFLIALPKIFMQPKATKLKSASYELTTNNVKWCKFGTATIPYSTDSIWTTLLITTGGNTGTLAVVSMRIRNSSGTISIGYDVLKTGASASNAIKIGYTQNGTSIDLYFYCTQSYCATSYVPLYYKSSSLNNSFTLFEGVETEDTPANTLLISGKFTIDFTGTGLSDNGVGAIKAGNTIFLNEKFNTTFTGKALSNNGVLGVVPYHPEQEINFMLYGTFNGTKAFYRAKIQTDGQIILLEDIGTMTDITTFYFNVSYCIS